MSRRSRHGEKAARQGFAVADAASALQSYKQAEALEAAGRPQDAERIYRALLETFPDEGAVLHNLGLILKGRREIAEAEVLLRHAAAVQPLDAAIRNSLGAVLFDAGKLAEAEGCYRKALGLHSDYAEAHYNLGVVFEAMGRQQDALQAYQEAIALQPNNARALTRVGALLQRHGLLKDALDCLDRACELAPEFFDAHYYRGCVLSKQSKFDDAMAALGRAAQIKPRSVESTVAMANALRDSGRIDDALSAYWRALELRPERLETHEEINKLAWAAGRHDLFLRSFQYAKERIGDNADVIELEAAFQLRRKRFVAAESLLRRADMLAPQRGSIAGLLARALAGQQRFAESYPLFFDAATLEPQVLLHRLEFAFALLRDSKPRDALKVLDQADAIAGTDRLLLAARAVAYRQLEDERYADLIDYGKYVRAFDLPHPPGFVDVRAFNEALAAELDALHVMRAEPIDQTLRSGTQTSGALFGESSPAIAALRALTRMALDTYIRELPDEARNPLAQLRGRRFDFVGSWSCRLGSGGFHDNHVHPQGWISSAYYARLPSAVADGTGQQGWLKFGESNLGLGGRDRAERLVQPTVGRLVLFPSFYWHGTVPFSDAASRLAVAFDAAPVADGDASR